MAVNLNRANLEDLTKLHGIAEGTAEKIIDYRNEHGIFRSWEDVKRIPGFGDSLVEHLKDGGLEVGEEYIDIVKDLTKQLSDTYLTSFKLGLSLWENNLKMMNGYVRQLVSMQKNMYRPLIDIANGGGDSPLNNNFIEKMFSIQRDYIEQIGNISEREVQKLERKLRENT